MRRNPSEAVYLGTGIPSRKFAGSVRLMSSQMLRHDELTAGSWHVIELIASVPPLLVSHHFISSRLAANDTATFRKR